jgi:hypothetical protein
MTSEQSCFPLKKADKRLFRRYHNRPLLRSIVFRDRRAHARASLPHNQEFGNEDPAMNRYAILASVLALTFACSASAQRGSEAAARSAAPLPEPATPSDVLAGRPDADPDQTADLLGPLYESKAHSISLHPPKDSVPQRHVGSRDIIEFVNETKGWRLKLSKIMLDKPGALAEFRDPKGTLQPGVLEFTAKRLKEEIPDAEFLRQDVISTGEADVGMIALRYTRNLKSLLSQQAIIQRTDQVYYMLAFTTPGASRGNPDQQGATSEREAVETFRQVLDSVRLLDEGATRQDQDARLIRTRALLANLPPPRLQAALREKQWTRILKNGKDIGYSYIEERDQPLEKGGREGIEIRIRSRVLPGNDVQVDVGSILIASMDLYHEDWSTIVQTANVKQIGSVGYKPPQVTEFGVSDRQPGPGRGDIYNLQVLFESTAGERVDPINQKLPPFYMPQAISHLLPRLVPIRAPKAYLFAVYVPDARAVMMRYLDVLAAKQVTFNNKTVRAVPVEDRLGLEGSVTIHYMTSDQVWIGSENKDTGVTVIPSDEMTLLALWNDANLTRPEAPKPQNVAPVTGTPQAGPPAQPKPQQLKAAPTHARDAKAPASRTGGNPSRALPGLDGGGN